MKVLASIARVLPLLVPIVVAALAIQAGASMNAEGVTDREVLNWIFWLLTGLTVSLLLDQVVSRWLSNPEHTEVKNALLQFGRSLDERLSSYSAMVDAGIDQPDLGARRVEKAIARTQQARASVYKCGVAFSNLLRREYFDVWRELLTRCQVRLALLDPEWLEQNAPTLTLIADHLDRKPAILIAEIRQAISNLCELWELLSPQQRLKLEVRVYQRFPSATCDLTDVSTPSERLLVEILPYRCGFRNRPHLNVRPSPGGWYQPLQSCFEQIWAGAKRIDLHRSSSA